MIRLEMTSLERVEVALIVKKMVENKLRWFRHLEIRPIDIVAQRVEHMEER